MDCWTADEKACDLDCTCGLGGEGDEVGKVVEEVDVGKAEEGGGEGTRPLGGETFG